MCVGTESVLINIGKVFPVCVTTNLKQTSSPKIPVGPHPTVHTHQTTEETAVSVLVSVSVCRSCINSKRQKILTNTPLVSGLLAPSDLLPPKICRTAYSQCRKSFLEKKVAESLFWLPPAAGLGASLQAALNIR